MGNAVHVAESEHVQRFGLSFRIQHIVLFLSKILLVITGFSLWFLARPDYMFWTEQSSQGFWSLATIRWLHRVGAVGMIGVAIYHLLWTIYSPTGRREFLALLPRVKDVTDVTQNSLYFLGLRKKPPQFARFAYYEKFDYWAVYWGCVIMIGTGLILWFDRYFARVIPWLPYEQAALIHAYEAFLATAAVVVWHFYNVHFKPSRFPGSMLWWHGKISREEMQEEHALEYEAMMEKKTAES